MIDLYPSVINGEVIWETIRDRINRNKKPKYKLSDSFMKKLSVWKSKKAKLLDGIRL